MSLQFLLKSFSEEDGPQLADKGAISLTGVLQRKRVKLSKAKPYRKASKYFNPYAIAYGFCMREKVAQLCDYHDIMVKPPTPKEEMRFAVGNKYHDIIQGFFHKTGMLEGYFSCNHCQRQWWDRSPTHCEKCGATRRYLNFEEVPLRNEEYQINGRSDGIVWVEVAKNVEEKHIMDIKSIRNKGIGDTGSYQVRNFECLDTQGPVEHHLVQLHLYMMMSGIHNGHLLYVATNTHQLKSFHITYNAALLDPYLGTIREALDWVEDLKEGKCKELPAPCDSKKCVCEEIIVPRNGGITKTLS